VDLENQLLKQNRITCTKVLLRREEKRREEKRREEKQTTTNNTVSFLFFSFCCFLRVGVGWLCSVAIASLFSLSLCSGAERELPLNGYIINFNIHHTRLPSPCLQERYVHAFFFFFVLCLRILLCMLDFLLSSTETSTSPSPSSSCTAFQKAILKPTFKILSFVPVLYASHAVLSVDVTTVSGRSMQPTFNPEPYVHDGSLKSKITDDAWMYLQVLIDPWV